MMSFLMPEWTSFHSQARNAPLACLTAVCCAACNQLPSWTVNNAKQFPQYCLGMANGTVSLHTGPQDTHCSLR